MLDARPSCDWPESLIRSRLITGRLLDPWADAMSALPVWPASERSHQEESSLAVTIAYAMLIAKDFHTSRGPWL
jgi:hypothetical protein